MYKCKVIYSVNIKNKQNSELSKCCGRVFSSLASETSEVLRIRQKGGSRNKTFDHIDIVPFSGSFWQRHNQNRTPTHKTHRSIIKPYRYIVVV